ncbi:unnamed protein product [Oncorhynchus mykiss]|uniref:Calponin-homology (CH) domain-containing protein n=1 Tax=Oncorhynchus mykiss TaxID=8022 RepID=A0A060Z601_ONCMY|nr:unnamed protein product [Oncorhynchus mykiss]
MCLPDICLKVVSSIADSLYNIQLLREFCNEYLNRSFHLRPEDVLYAPPVLKHNVMVFIAELFWWFEILKPDFVQPRDLQEVKDVRSLLQPKDSRPHVSISNATKRSFLATPGSPDIITTSQSPDICNRYYLKLTFLSVCFCLCVILVSARIGISLCSRVCVCARTCVCAGVLVCVRVSVSR